jgi:hypothetical protein
MTFLYLDEFLSNYNLNKKSAAYELTILNDGNEIFTIEKNPEITEQQNSLLTYLENPNTVPHGQIRHWPRGETLFIEKDTRLDLHSSVSIKFEIGLVVREYRDPSNPATFIDASIANDQIKTYPAGAKISFTVSGLIKPLNDLLATINSPTTTGFRTIKKLVAQSKSYLMKKLLKKNTTYKYFKEKYFILKNGAEFILQKSTVIVYEVPTLILLNGSPMVIGAGDKVSFLKKDKIFLNDNTILKNLGDTLYEFLTDAYEVSMNDGINVMQNECKVKVACNQIFELEEENMLVLFERNASFEFLGDVDIIFYQKTEFVDVGGASHVYQPWSRQKL